jgi:hypothetical protein
MKHHQLTGLLLLHMNMLCSMAYMYTALEGKSSSTSFGRGGSLPYATCMLILHVNKLPQEKLLPCHLVESLRFNSKFFSCALR